MKPVTEDLIRQMVRTIVAAVHPERIILFGSQARRDAKDHVPHLIVSISTSSKTTCRQTRSAVYTVLWVSMPNARQARSPKDRPRAAVLRRNPPAISAWTVVNGRIAKPRS